MNTPRGREKPPLSDSSAESGATTRNEGSGTQKRRERLPYPGGSGFDDPDLQPRIPTPDLDLDREERRTHWMLVGLWWAWLVAWVLTLLWALGWALDQPAAWALREVR